MTPTRIHQFFIDQAIPSLSDDKRILGVAVGGSYITGDMDEYSDLDLVLVCDPYHFGELLKDRQTVAERLGNLLSAFTGEHVGEPRLLICLYQMPELLHVDLKFVDPEGFTQNRVEDPIILWERDDDLSRALSDSIGAYPPVDAQWIEDRFWTWVHYSACKLARGELYEVIEGLSLLRTSVLAPMAKTLMGKRPRAVRMLEQELPHYLDKFNATLPTQHEKGEVARAYKAAIALYQELREAWPTREVVRQTNVEMLAMRFLVKVLEGGRR